MGKKEAKKSFRCTEQENDFIKAQAQIYKIKESEFIRRAIFEKPDCRIHDPEVLKCLEEIKYYGLKIGTNINQVVKFCNAKNYMTREDYLDLIKYLRQLDRKYGEAVETLKSFQKDRQGGQEDGNHKITQDQ